jgi:hypothetical protein
MIRDMTQRVTLAWVDNKQRQNKVNIARRLIYENKRRVDSAAVENLLKEESWVPTVVRSQVHNGVDTIDSCDLPECILRKVVAARIQSVPYICRRSDA